MSTTLTAVSGATVPGHLHLETQGQDSPRELWRMGHEDSAEMTRTAHLGLLPAAH